MSSLWGFDVLNPNLATLDAVFLFHLWKDIGPVCACRCLLYETDADALCLTEVNRCVPHQRKPMAGWGDFAGLGHAEVRDV